MTTMMIDARRNSSVLVQAMLNDAGERHAMRLQGERIAVRRAGIIDGDRQAIALGHEREDVARGGGIDGNLIGLHGARLDRHGREIR